MPGHEALVVILGDRTGDILLDNNFAREIFREFFSGEPKK
jgi:hypothetical protein